MRNIPPLIMLAEGRKPRPRKAPAIVQRELDLHFAVVKTLRDFGCAGWRWSHFPAGEARDARAGAKLKRMGTMAGWPDLILISPRGVFHGLELKRKGGKLSDAQSSFQSWAITEGINYSVADNLDCALAVLSHWGAVKISIAGGAQ